MTSALDISKFMDRIALLQSTVIPNSAAYAYYAIQQRNDLYFVNRLGAISSESIASFQRRYTVTVNSLFRVALLTSNVQTAHYEIETQQYIFDILEYFQKRPSLTVNPEPLTVAETILDYMVPRSLNVTCDGVQAFSEGNQTAIGAAFNYTFSVNIDG